MHVRWTDDAVSQLNDIVDFLAPTSDSLAQRVALEIYNGAESLGLFSFRGRRGPSPGTRELVLPASGYILTYEVVGDGVFILGLHHGAEDRPQR